jgi:hypothetical protein
MGGRLMKQQLQEISNKIHPEAIDLWPEIYAALKETKTMKTPPRISFVLSRVAAIFILFFLGAAVVYAVSQIYVDSGLEGERAERLVTPINQSVTHANLTIQFDWAYIDVSRISFGFTVFDAEGNIYLPVNKDLQYWTQLQIHDRNEHFGNDTEAYVSSFEIPTLLGTYDNENPQQVYSQEFFFDDLPTNQVEMDVRIQFPFDSPYSFNFAFPITVYPALFVLEDTPMNSDSAIQMNLTEFSLTPTLTSGTICFQLPPEYQRTFDTHQTSTWRGSGIHIYFDGQDISALYPNLTGYVVPIDAGIFQGCTLFRLAIPLDSMPQTILIMMEEMRENNGTWYTREEAELIQEIYQQHNVDVNIRRIYYVRQRGVTYDRIYYHEWPEDWRELSIFEQQTLYEAVMDDFYATNPDAYRLIGPWEIEFELNEPSS